MSKCPIDGEEACNCDECVDYKPKKPSRRELADKIRCLEEVIDSLQVQVATLRALSHAPCAGPHYYNWPTTTTPNPWPYSPVWTSGVGTIGHYQ